MLQDQQEDCRSYDRTLKLDCFLALQLQRSVHSKAVTDVSSITAGKKKLRSKNDFICHVMKVKAATSVHYMADHS